MSDLRDQIENRDTVITDVQRLGHLQRSRVDTLESGCKLVREKEFCKDLQYKKRVRGKRLRKIRRIVRKRWNGIMKPQGVYNQTEEKKNVVRQ